MENINHVDYIINKYGLSRHPLYPTWYSMIARCYHKRSTRYHDYGGRGITVCDEWRKNAKEFIYWADNNFIKGTTLDRINNDKGYSPENCRYVKTIIQNNNKRLYKNNTSGYAGVRLNNAGTYTARVKVKNKYIHIGNYADIIEAVKERDCFIEENNLLNKKGFDSCSTNP